MRPRPSPLRSHRFVSNLPPVSQPHAAPHSRSLPSRMKLVFVSRATLLMAVLSVWAFATGCGGGSNPGSAVVGGAAPTQNPLVAQYTIASACAGQGMVEFGPDTSYGRSTAWSPLPGSFQRSSILVAGMRASTTYHMRAQVQCGGETLSGPDTTFTTGPLPSIAFPTLTVSRPNPSLSSLENPGVEMVTVTVAGTPALFTDRDANPIWYYDVGPQSYPFTFKLLPNGHMLLSITGNANSLLREVDLAGNQVRQMTIAELQGKMQSAGYDFVPGGFHHDILPLPNGHVIVLVDCWQPFDNLAGYTGTTTVQGDGVIDLDENWNPVWAWNSFDHLDVNRHLEPVITNGVLDWTHSNALVYSPTDGNILVSMRHQSWVLKLDYNNGAGTGNVLWHLGYQGDFALTLNGAASDDPSLWFSFQHFPTILSQSGSQTNLAIWDNGDNRVLDTSGTLCVNPVVGGSVPACYSRPTIFQVDESAMTANLSWATPEPDFGVWGGSINQLGNGNVEFDMNAPALLPFPNAASQVQEVTQSSTPEVVWEMDLVAPSTAYRAYRFPSLYNGVAWQY
jgi:arylsulfate sulfotransferase